MSTLTRDQVFDQLAALGVASVRIGFYGGGDEGDVDGIAYLDANDRDIDVALERDAPLSEALCQPIYDRYGGFDGDPEIDGELIWTVADHTLAIEASEKSWTWFEEAL